MPDDPARDARAYEPVAAAAEELVAGIEVMRPGVCATGARGPARYFGGEEIVAERLVEHIAQQCGVEAQVGVADGVLAAWLAARSGRLIPPGGTPAFLSGFDVAVLGRPALVDLLRRLGVRTLAQFVALPTADVLARFGPDAALAHHLAAGIDARPLVPRLPPVDLSVTEDFEDPLERVDSAAFATRALAVRLHESLERHGLACTRLAIEAWTAAGQELHRSWRHEGLLTVADISDRLRWQLNGWLAGTGRDGARSPSAGARAAGVPSAGIVRLRLTPEGTVVHLGLQDGLWGDAGEQKDRAHRVLTRIQGLLGPDAVVTAVRGGGRGQAERARWVPFGDVRAPARPLTAPWPGALPPPAPATVYGDPLPVAVSGPDATPVTVTSRLLLSGPPDQVTIGGRSSVVVAGWAGPWVVDERWWTTADSRRYARLQVLLADGQALLLALAGRGWGIEARYD